MQSKGMERGGEDGEDVGKETKRLVPPHGPPHMDRRRSPACLSAYLPRTPN
jgi:hypothetical protein